MAEVVKVPVVGEVKKPWLYAGAAAVAGMVGYAWWTAGSRQAEDEGFAVELPVTDYTPPTVVDSGISVGGSSVGEPIARTNVEWLAIAREQASALGFAQTVIASGLTKYLAKLSLTPTESSMIRAVVQVLGQPPSNGPYTITEGGPEPPQPHEALAAPANGVAVWRGWSNGKPMYLLRWDPVPGAASYEVVDPDATSHTTPTNSIENITTTKRSQIVEAKVIARDAAGNRGPVGAVRWWVGAQNS